jgi:hypothetical protein
MASESNDDLQAKAKAMGQVISRAWADPGYKQRFLTDPEDVLAEAGIDTPPGMELRAVENTANVVYITLPAPPSEELSDEALEAVAGGSTAGTAATAGTASTVSCPVLCFGTAGTAGSVGSA